MTWIEDTGRKGISFFLCSIFFWKIKVTFNRDKERRNTLCVGSSGWLRGTDPSWACSGSAAETAGGVGGQLLSCAFPVPICEMLFSLWVQVVVLWQIRTICIPRQRRTPVGGAQVELPPGCLRPPSSSGHLRGRGFENPREEDDRTELRH